MGALNIKDSEVAKKARKLAKLKGLSITAAVSAALDDSLRAVEHKTAARRKKIDALLGRFRAIVPPDSPAWDRLDDMYDETGSPK